MMVILFLFSHFHIYYGNFHSHTSYSDGKGTPASAFEIAKDSLGLDFYAITDHAELLNDSEWLDIKTQAELFTQEGIFIGIHGFEWDNRLDGNYPDSGQGDIIMWNSERYAGTELLDTTGEHEYFDTVSLLSDFYNWISNQPDTVYAAFAHPGIHMGPFVFDSLAYGGAGPDSHIVGIEAFNAHWIAHGYSYELFRSFYFLALLKGWHIGPMGNWDNHTLNPSTLKRTGVRTAILADSLTKAEIFSALSNLRFYTTDDKNLVLYFNAITHRDTFPMGSTITADSADFEVFLHDPDSENFAFINLYLGDSIIRTDSLSSPTCTLSYHLKITDSCYFVVEAMQQDGDVAITSPIWINPLLSVCEKSASYNATALEIYPNPSISSTNIRYLVTKPGCVDLRVYNLAGQLIKTLVNTEQKAGVYKIGWDGRDDKGKLLSSGVYFLKAKISDFLKVRKILLLRI